MIFFVRKINLPEAPAPIPATDIDSTSTVIDSRAVECAIILSRPWNDPCRSKAPVWPGVPKNN